MVFGMEQLDRGATEKVLRAMSVAGVDLDDLAAATGFKKSALVRRMYGETRWKVADLVLIAKAVDCRIADLVPEAA